VAVDALQVHDVLRTVREVHAATGKPVLVMSYWNPVSRYGVERFARELAALERLTHQFAAGVRRA
jgi:tryptophan synthase alpha subunit